MEEDLEEFDRLYENAWNAAETSSQKRALTLAMKKGRDSLLSEIHRIEDENRILFRGHSHPPHVSRDMTFNEILLHRIDDRKMEEISLRLREMVPNAFLVELDASDAEGFSFEEHSRRDKIKSIDALRIDHGGWNLLRQVDLDQYRPAVVNVKFRSLSRDDQEAIVRHLWCAGYDMHLWKEELVATKWPLVNPVSTVSEPSIVTKPVSKVKYAYATLVMKGDAYVPGALVLAHSVRATWPNRRSDKIELVCQVSPDVSREARQALSKVFDHIVVVDLLEQPSVQLPTAKQRQMYGTWMSAAYTKWHCLGFARYRKVAFLDADMIFLDNCDEVFDLSAPAGVFSAPWAKPFKSNGHFNPYHGKVRHGDVVSMTAIRDGLDRAVVAHGAFVVVPTGKDLFDQFVEFIRARYPVGHAGCYGALDEQSITEFLLRAGYSWTYLHQRFMSISWHPNWNEGKKPMVLHYFSAKPWNMPREEAWEDMKAWWNLADDLVEKMPDLGRWIDV